MKLTNEICISFLRGSGWLYNHDKQVIDDFVKVVKKHKAKEYKGDMKHNLAEMYAKNMVDYGVDVTKAWQTATQQSYALEKAYIRGRQYEVDRFIELRKEYNDGWIPCSERLPEESGYYLVTYHDWSDGNFLPKYDNTYVRRLHYQISDHFVGWNYPKNVDDRAENDCHKEVIAWQPLPEPYKERD